MLNEALTNSASAWEERAQHIHRDGGHKGKLKKKVKLLFKIQQFQSCFCVLFIKSITPIVQSVPTDI